MKKKEIRELYKSKRIGLSAVQKEKMNDLMLIQFQRLKMDIPGLIMTYSAIEKLNEFDAQLITDYCFFKNPNQVLFYPVLTQMDDLISVVVNDTTEFKTNKFGIDEPVNGLPMFPEEIDLVIVPLLAFDKNGFRVGYGKGYYDKFLKECREDVIKIGFSYFDPVDFISDINAFDVKLDCCITPQNIHKFNEQLNN